MRPRRAKAAAALGNGFRGLAAVENAVQCSNTRKGGTMITRAVMWSITLVAALAVYLWIGPTPLSAACPPSPQCPCP
jgi:hypothetical protein